MLIFLILVRVFSLGSNAFTCHCYEHHLSLARHAKSIHLQKSRLSTRITPFRNYDSQSAQVRADRNCRSKLHMASIDVIFRTYSDALQQYPFVTKGSTGLVLCGIGDLVAQKRKRIQMEYQSNDGIEPMNRIDYKRLARFATKGFFGALIWGAWYDLSAVIVSSENVALALASLGIRDGWIESNICINVARTFSSIAIEQFVVCPIIFGLWEIPAASILNNAPVRRIPYEVEDKLGNMLIANAKVWTVANLIIYNIPVQYRVGFSNLIDIFWQSIVSEFAAECGTKDETQAIDDSKSASLMPDDKALSLE